jgi:putative transport protein
MPSVWLDELARTQPMAHALLGLSVVAFSGLALGSIRFKGIKLGAAGVLFSGILLARAGLHLDHVVLDFVREAGLVLFVFMIGLQLGPGFFDSLRRDGLRLNLLALCVLALGTLGAVIAAKLLGVPHDAAVGLLAGATTNTPSLGAAQQALSAAGAGAATDGSSHASALAAAYAVAYPMGIAGIIGSLLLLRAVLRIDVSAEHAALEEQRRRTAQTIERRALIVDNPNLDGVAIRDLPAISHFRVRLARHRAAGSPSVQTARASTVLHRGDVLLAVGVAHELDQFERLIGRRSDEDLTAAPGDVVSRRVVVTHKDTVGRAIDDLHLGQRFGVQLTRVSRSDVEFTPQPELRLRLGDVLNLVGDEASVDRAAAALGNSVKALQQTHLLAIFVGVALGVALGLLPVAVPGLPAPVRLGLAGGPLIIAILVGRAGRLGPVLFHVPHNANIALRELGITLFLACVGLKAGATFFEIVLTPEGARWIAIAGAIALLPPLVVGLFARLALKMPFATLSGLLAGSTTDPPALAFATGVCRSDDPNVSYATVYPLTMMLRIVIAQLLVITLAA